jgi:hypothetical protein
MARLARVVIPGLPHPVTRRGNGAARTFFDDDARVGGAMGACPHTALPVETHSIPRGAARHALYALRVFRQVAAFAFVASAVATWALVSEEVDRRLREQAGRHLRLRPDEWTSGEIGWLIDAVGRPVDVRSAMQWLAGGPFKERPLNVIVRDAQGAASATTLDKLVAGSAEDGSVAE